MLFLITTIVFGLMALAPQSAPIKTEAIQRAAQSSEEQDITDVATRFTSNLLTYNANTVDRDINEALSDATSEFGAKPIDAFDGRTIASIKAEIKKNKSQSTTTVKAATITTRDDDTATVIVVSTRRYVSQGKPGQELPVVELTLVSTADGWKVDNAAPVSGD